MLFGTTVGGGGGGCTSWCFKGGALEDQLVTGADFASFSICAAVEEQEEQQSSSIISNTTATRLLSSVKESSLCDEKVVNRGFLHRVVYKSQCCWLC